MLAELFGESAVVTVNDIKPDVFHQLLWYVYGGTVPETPLKEYAKDIIDAADKYSIVNLKLEAEAAYVESTTITADNAMDNLLYADAKNLAVLKEAVMDFLAAHGGEVIGNVSFAQFPPQLVSDLLVATTRRNEGDSGRDDDFTTMRVSELRRKLHEKGLGMNVDGSREAMIEALRSGAAES
jgi:speckle-type POZ protein